MRTTAFLSSLLAIVPFVPVEATAAAETNFPEAGKSYTLRMSAQNGSCIYENADGTLTVGTYDPSIRCFWEFIPTGKPNCFYIRNLTTGHYIQSTNRPANATSIMKAGTEKVEFYVGQNTASGTATSGFWYFSSTDNTVYDKVSDETKGLNKDGSTSNVIVFMCGQGRKNSFWKISEDAYAYEVHPFMSSASAGKADFKYEVRTSTQKYLGLSADNRVELQEQTGANGQEWYFVGESNAAGGYLILSAANHQAVGPDLSLKDDAAEAQRWHVFEVNQGGGTFYVFRPSENGGKAAGALTIGGDSLLSFVPLRSDFQLGHQIYNLPCGALGKTYISQFALGGEGVVTPLAYPLHTLNASGSATQIVSTKPANWYTLYTKSRAAVARGKAIEMKVTTAAVPVEGSTLYAYCDWDADGVFETAVPLTGAGKEYTGKVTVPTDAPLKNSRLRVRLTANGLPGAEDDVEGQTLDVIVKVVEAADHFSVTATASAPERGTVAIEPAEESYAPGTAVTATATPRGNAQFVCWREGNDVVSLDKVYAFSVDHATSLTAYFSPKTKDVPDGIQNATAERNALVEVEADAHELNVITDAAVQAVQVYNPNGALVAQSGNKCVRLNGVAAGSYIVKVQLAGKDTAVKIHIQ